VVLGKVLFIKKRYLSDIVDSLVAVRVVVCCVVGPCAFHGLVRSALAIRPNRSRKGLKKASLSIVRSISVVAIVMRHTSWETTQRHYAGDDVQKDAEVLLRLLESPASSPVPTSARYTLTSV